MNFEAGQSLFSPTLCLFYSGHVGNVSDDQDDDGDGDDYGKRAFGFEISL